ncbi:serine protease [Comamonadaceae bacterium OH2545_COT-014]|nr:serine protease [Comamonadaceae bacterium OH2545_COT-014]
MVDVLSLMRRLAAGGVLSALSIAAGAQGMPPSAFVAERPALAAGGSAEAHALSPTVPQAPPSPVAQQIYRAARDKLVQIRTLRRATNTQSSIGSGFYVGGKGLVMTNFHVVSDLALEPDRHRGVSVSVGGEEGELALLAFDVRHDLAVLRHVQAQAADTAAVPSMLTLRPESEPLAQGERIYSLGNPLDVGFAITEGTYNGLVQRSFYPRIFFGGALNPGMSGGPALDAQGRVIGVNVAKRGDAEQVSFLVPGTFVQALLARARHAEPLREAAHGEMARQLLLHQQALVDRVLAAPPRHERYGGYLVPVPDESLARCWGDGQERRADALMDYERSECRIDSGVFTGHAGEVGELRMRYESYEGQRLNPLAFARQYSASFANEPLPQRRSRVRSAAECREDFVQLAGMPVRAVLCLTAYRKLPGLHDLAVLVASVNQSKSSVLGRLDVRGLSFDNALRLARHYLDGFAWEGEAP